MQANDNTAVVLRWGLVLWLAVFVSAAWQLDLKFAWEGYSPMDWVNQYTVTANVAGSFPNGILGYRYSAPMHLYVWAETLLGIPAEYFMYVMVAVEIAALMAAMYFLQRELRPKEGAWVALLVLVFVTTSWFRDVNLARFGQPVFWGLYYTIADALRIAAAVFVLRGNYRRAAVMLGAAFATHPPLGLIGFAVCGAMALADRGVFKLRPALFAVAIFVALCAAWSSLFRNVGMGDGGIPHDLWLGLTRAMSWHWYPVEYGVFGAYYNERLFGLSAILLLAIHYIPKDSIGKRVMAGIGMALFLSIAGVLISWLYPEPFLVKLSLHRASDMIVLLALPYVVSGLASDLRHESKWVRVLSAGVLFSPFIYHRGVPLLLALPLLYLCRRRNAAADAWSPRLQNMAWRAGAILLLGYSIAYLDLPWDWKDFVRWGGLLALMAGAGAYGYLAQWKSESFQRGVGLAICALCAAWLGYTGLRTSNRQEVEAYKDVQLWARANTPVNALFMSDPNLVGWRDFSRRASFGGVYDWLYSGWLYDSKKATFEEGLNRFSALSGNLQQGLGLPRSLDGRYVYMDQTFKGYYGASDSVRREWAQKYGISYFVFRKKYLESPVSLPVAYQNEFFLVVSVSR